MDNPGRPTKMHTQRQVHFFLPFIDENWLYSNDKKGKPIASEKAKKLKQRLAERKALLLHNMQGKRRANALKDAEKILDSLNVYTVEEIQRGTLYQP